MKLVKYDYSPYRDPFAALDRLFEDSFFGFDRDLLNARTSNPYQDQTLRVNVSEDENAYFVEAQLPGFTKKDVEVELENAVLTISAERKQKKGDHESVEKRSRSITVGEDIDSNKVSAKIENGILTVTLPKTEERKPKSIIVL
jgi:HSP20 family protein